MSTRQHVTHPVDVCGSEKALTRAIPSGKSVLPGSERVRIATLAVIAAAKACGLTLKQAQELAASQVEVAATIVAHPEREAELRRKAALATEAVVVLFRGKRAA